MQAMQTFAQYFERWHDFYMLAGTSAATLIGLLFVSLTLNIEVMRDESQIGLRELATQTFGSFLYILLISLLLLIPDNHPQFIGIQLLILGTFGLVNAFRWLQPVIGNLQATWAKTYLFWRFILPTVSYLGLIVISLAVWQGRHDGLFSVVYVIFILLVTATHNAWDLLVGISHKKLGVPNSPKVP